MIGLLESSDIRLTSDRKDPDGLIIKKPDSASASPDLFTVRDITVDMDIGKVRPVHVYL